VELDELLKKSDIISLHCTLNEETLTLLIKKHFHDEQKTGLINTARGEVIDEKALLDAQILEIFIVQAGCFEDEPVTTRQNELITTAYNLYGHYAWYSDRSILEYRKGCSKLLIYWRETG